jgi:AcrR family transcriptional regulator
LHDRIISETIFLIQQNGFNFTVSDLAKKIGTSKRTIYQHFSSKDQIIDEIIEKLISQIKEREQEIAKNEEIDLLEKIDLILCCTPKEFEIMDIRLLSDLKKHHFSQWEKLDYFLREEWTTVLYLMKKGIEQGIIRNINLEVFIELYLGAINQIYNPKSLSQSQNQLSIREKLQTVVDVLLYGISDHKKKGGD